MGVVKFRFSPPDLADQVPDLRRAYMTGIDRTPSRLALEFRPGLMVCRRDFPESGRLHVPWPVEGHGRPVVGTATLAERDEPHELVVELARGKLNDVRNQAADWKQLGLRTPAAFDDLLRDARRAFARSATSRHEPEESAESARISLTAAHDAARLLIVAYTDQVLLNRLSHASRLPTWLATDLVGHPRDAPWVGSLGDALNAARIDFTWARLAPEQGQSQWDQVDAQLAACRKRRLTPMASPLLEFGPTGLPDWIWLWEGDVESIFGMALDLVRQALTRYRGKIPTWTIAHRPASGELLGLSEEEQVHLTAKALQVARQADPKAQLVVSFDRPWAEWMGGSSFQLGPLHLADELARAELGLSGIGLEIAPGFGPPGSQIRDLLEFSKLLDLYSLLNLPLHVTLALPSTSTADSKALESAQVEPSQWPEPPDEIHQSDWALQWVALAVAKPFVRSVTWLQASDAPTHLYAHAGLFRADHTPKPLFDRIKSFRHRYLE